MAEITAEAFYCPIDDCIVRGTDMHESPGPDGSIIITATCTRCGGKVSKTVHLDDPISPAPLTFPGSPGSVKGVGGSPFSTLGLDSSLGTIRLPSPSFWDAYVAAIAAKLPSEFADDPEAVANLSWHVYLDDAQKQVFFDRFKDTGALEVPADVLEAVRNNPKKRGSSVASTLVSALSFAQMVNAPDFKAFAAAFWTASMFAANTCSGPLVVIVRDWEHPIQYRNSEVEASRAKGLVVDVHASVGGLPIAYLTPLWGPPGSLDPAQLTVRDRKYMSKPPTAFRLRLQDSGYYSHSEFRSYVQNPSPVIAAAIHCILEAAPIVLGSVSLRDGELSFREHHGAPDWLDSKSYDVIFTADNLPKTVSPFWKSSVIKRGRALKEMPVPVSDLGRVQVLIDAKEAVFNKHIDKLYLDDAELAKKLDLSPLGVAKLMGDSEYGALLEQRDKLMWAEADAPAEPSESP